MEPPGCAWLEALRAGARSRPGWLAGNGLVFAPLLVLLAAVDGGLRQAVAAPSGPPLIFGGFLAVVQGAGPPFLGLAWTALVAALIGARLVLDGSRAPAAGLSPLAAAVWLAVLLGSLACGDWLTARYAGLAAAAAGWPAYLPGVAAVCGVLGAVRFYWRLATAPARRAAGGGEAGDEAS